MRRRVCLAAVAGMGLACAWPGERSSVRRSSGPRAPAPSDLELNFVGVSVANWDAAYRFYTSTLGIRTEARDGNWAMLGGGWDAYLAGRSRGMVFELFDGARPPPPDRWWGHQQAIRPSIHVPDLDSAVAMARQRGVRFTSSIALSDGGRQIEFVAPEGIRWTLAQRPGRDSGPDLSRPYIGLAEIKTVDLPRQTAFYRDIMGLRVERQDTTRVLLGQSSGAPKLALEPGGEKHLPQSPGLDPPTRTQPVFLSFMTNDLRQTATRLRRAQISILRDLQHQSWGGTDLMIADADGNVIQVVEYDVHRRHGSQRPPTAGAD